MEVPIRDPEGQPDFSHTKFSCPSLFYARSAVGRNRTESTQAQGIQTKQQHSCVQGSDATVILYRVGRQKLQPASPSHKQRTRILLSLAAQSLPLK